jgi:hypothetical protein
MCVPYKGGNYYYGFELKVSVKGGGERGFSIAISNYREETRDFSGLCLNNQLNVVSSEKIPYRAFFDIINSIVKITILSEKNYLPTSRKYNAVHANQVRDTVFLKKFNEGKKTGKSLEYYEQLKDYFEKPAVDIPKEKKPDIYDSLNILFFRSLLRARKSDIKNIEYFRL